MSTSRLSRLLYIVPYVAARGTVPVKEMAEKVGVSRAKLREDISLLSFVGQPPLTPDHLIDIYIEDNMLHIYLDQSLSRPLRITHDEARALALAVSIVPGMEDGQLDNLVMRLSSQLESHEARWVQTLAKRLAGGASEASKHPLLAPLRQAIESSTLLNIDYYSAASSEQKRYILAPIGIVVHSGQRYLVALDTEQENTEKLFRLDRMANAAVTDKVFTPPAGIDLERFRRDSLFSGKTGSDVRVGFSEAVAAMVLDRFPRSAVKESENGLVEITVQSASDSWMRRWVLPFGEDAEILAPAQQRQLLGEFCANAARAYGAEV